MERSKYWRKNLENKNLEIIKSDKRDNFPRAKGWQGEVLVPLEPSMSDIKNHNYHPEQIAEVTC